jgi:hypothetical protein
MKKHNIRNIHTKSLSLKHRSMRLHIQPAPRPRDAGMIRRPSATTPSPETTAAQANRNCATQSSLGVHAFEIADEEHPKIQPLKRPLPTPHRHIGNRSQRARFIFSWPMVALRWTIDAVRYFLPQAAR